MSDVDEFYDDASSEFPSVDDLSPLASSSNPKTVGRLVAIWAKANGTRKGDNGDYGFTDSLTLVLDDGPEGDQYTDLVGPAPVEVELQHSTAGIHSRLKPRVDGWSKARKDADGNVIAPSVPLKFRPVIGRINTQASTKYKKGSPAFSISEPSEADREIIKANKDLIISINERLATAAEGAEDAKAFE